MVMMLMLMLICDELVVGRERKAEAGGREGEGGRGGRASERERA